MGAFPAAAPGARRLSCNKLTIAAPLKCALFSIFSLCSLDEDRQSCMLNFPLACDFHAN